MPNKRSPNCPAHALGEAIDKVRAIYAAEGRNSFSGQVAVSRMGYNGLNGASRRALGAVRGYGLLEGRGRELRVSDDAVLIIADADAEDQRDRRAALLRALRHNRVFADLHERFSSYGSVQEISRYLQKRYSFKPAAADRTAQIYRRSVVILEEQAPRRVNVAGAGGRLALAESPGRTAATDAGALEKLHRSVDMPPRGQAIPTDDSSPSQAADLDPGATPDKSVNNAPQSQVAPRSYPSSGQLSLRLPGNRQDSFTLEQGTALLSWPEQMSREEFEDFTDWLLLEHRKIARSVTGGSRLLLTRQDDSQSR